MHRFLKSVFNSNVSATRVFAKGRFRPGLEHLEDRWTPASIPPPVPLQFCTVLLSLDGHNLFINGTNGADNAVITQTDSSNQLQVVCNGKVSNWPSSPITKIEVDLEEGKDTLEHNLVGNYFFSKTLDYNLGGGHDELKMDFHGTGTVIGEYLDIKLDAGGGNDSVTANFGRKQGGQLNFEAKMQDGHDKVSVNMWGDIHLGADVFFDLYGDAGDDTFTSENISDENDGNGIDISSTSTFTINMKGGNEADRLTALYTGKVFGDLTILMEGEANNDKVFAELVLQSNSSKSTGDVDAKLLGGTQSDRMYLYIDEQPGSNVNLVNALLDFGTGADDRYKASMTSNNVLKLNYDGSY